MDWKYSTHKWLFYQRSNSKKIFQNDPLKDWLRKPPLLIHTTAHEMPAAAFPSDYSWEIKFIPWPCDVLNKVQHVIEQNRSFWLFTNHDALPTLQGNNFMSRLNCESTAHICCLCSQPQHVPNSTLLDRKCSSRALSMECKWLWDFSELLLKSSQRWRISFFWCGSCCCYELLPDRRKAERQGRAGEPTWATAGCSVSLNVCRDTQCKKTTLNLPSCEASNPKINEISTL